MRKYGKSLEAVEEYSMMNMSKEGVDDNLNMSNKEGKKEEAAEAAEEAEVVGEVKMPVNPLKEFEEGSVDIFYLTADTDNVLEEVPWNDHTVYVIGAIVDRNRMTRAAVR